MCLWSCPDERTQEKPVTNPKTPRHVEVKDEGDHTVAEAEVTTDRGPEGTVRTSMHAKNAHVRPGHRARLVDAVMDLPEVQASDRVEAAIPYGDGESLERLRERTEDAQARAAGATTLLDANIPSGRGAAGQQQADNQADGERSADGQQPGDG
jgi:hypothetical protein